MGKDKIQMRITFEGVLAERLNAIKEYLQLESYTDVVRICITEKYERIKEKEKT